MTTEERIQSLEREVAWLKDRLQLAFAAFDGRAPTPEWRPARAVEGIIAAVCAEFDLGREQLLSESRLPRVVLPRQAAMFLARRETELSLQEIGIVFGDRDHGTVSHAVKSIQDRLDTDFDFQARIVRVRQSIKLTQPEIVKAA